MDWFLYSKGLRHERVKVATTKTDSRHYETGIKTLCTTLYLSLN